MSKPMPFLEGIGVASAHFQGSINKSSAAIATLAGLICAAIVQVISGVLILHAIPFRSMNSGMLLSMMVFPLVSHFISWKSDAYTAFMSTQASAVTQRAGAALIQLWRDSLILKQTHLDRFQLSCAHQTYVRPIRDMQKELVRVRLVTLGGASSLSLVTDVYALVAAVECILQGRMTWGEFMTCRKLITELQTVVGQVTPLYISAQRQMVDATDMMRVLHGSSLAVESTIRNKTKFMSFQMTTSRSKIVAVPPKTRLVNCACGCHCNRLWCRTWAKMSCCPCRLPFSLTTSRFPFLRPCQYSHRECPIRGHRHPFLWVSPPIALTI